MKYTHKPNFPNFLNNLFTAAKKSTDTESNTLDYTQGKLSSLTSWFYMCSIIFSPTYFFFSNKVYFSENITVEALVICLTNLSFKELDSHFPLRVLFRLFPPVWGSCSSCVSFRFYSSIRCNSRLAPPLPWDFQPTYIVEQLTAESALAVPSSSSPSLHY